MPDFSDIVKFEGVAREATFFHTVCAILQASGQ